MVIGPVDVLLLCAQVGVAHRFNVSTGTSEARAPVPCP
jgi:hypothetical protein